MVHKLALLFGALGSLGVVALALALGGSVFPVTASVDGPGAAGGVEQIVDLTESPAGEPSPTLETIVDVIYVETPTGDQGSTDRDSSAALPLAAPASPTSSDDGDDDHGRDHRDDDDEDRDDEGRDGDRDDD